MRGAAAAITAAILALLIGVQLGKWSRAHARSTKTAEPRTLKAGQANADANSLTAISLDPSYVTVQAKTVTPKLQAYGQVEPISTLPMNAAEEGTVVGLSVLPGMRVRIGEKLAHLSGPAIQAALQQSEANIRSAQAQLTAAQKTLAIERGQLHVHLSTRAAVQQAESAAAQAQTNFENAQSHLQAVEQMATLSAPAGGTVLAVTASDGELVSAGQTILRIQTTGRLWLQATYYGSEWSQIRVGTRGAFAPANGSAAIPVRVEAVSGAAMAGGGETVGLVPMIANVQWINGEFGAVTLNLPARKLVAVPTRALILDRGKWWVLMHTPHGYRSQPVVPGPARGWDTFLESGVDPGTQVIAQNAYLLFHRGISKSYQPPD